MNRGTKFLAGWLLLMLLLPFLLVIPVGAAGSESTAEPVGQGIKIMSYNVMDDCSANSNGVFPYDSPANREDAIVEMLKVYEPDVIGMQEAGDGGVSGILDWCSALNEDLKDTYAYRSLTDETGFKMDICRGLIIFYKKDRFTLLESGAQGYSQPANNKRCYQWVKLRDNETAVEFFVFNTHWTVDGKITLEENEAIRTVEMQELANKVNSIAKDQHAILTGDFNSFYSPKNSMGDTVNITRLQEQTGFVDALLTTEEIYSVNAAGTQTLLQQDDKGLMTSADHVVYPADFYTPVKVERILSRTYTPKLSDHDAFLVHFNYKHPELSASAQDGNLDVYYSNGAYYIDNLKKSTKDLAIQVSLPQGEIYTDAQCTQSAGWDLTIKNAVSKTYLAENTYYIRFGNLVYPLYLRGCNSNTPENMMFVDPSLTDKPVGSEGLYCDKWYCRKVTVGVNGFATIQEAVNAAPNDCRIMVAPGVYEEEVSYSGKNLQFQGSNRNNVKALVTKNGQLTVNPNRTYETYIKGNIAFSMGTLDVGTLEVNGFHFIGSVNLGQIRISGGNAKKTVELRISNNLFCCSTYGSANSGSAILGNSAVQKVGNIEDNYFHLADIPTYTDDSGNLVNYANRAITLRNMADITIHANYFDGYTGNKIRPIWLSSETGDGSTTPGYGNLALTGNRFENSTSASIFINNIRDHTEANVFIAGNSYGGELVTINFSDTAKQTAQNLPSDKTKITFSVQAEDYPNIKILPKTDHGIDIREFTQYVTFRNDKGTAFYGHCAVEDRKVQYNGPLPEKDPSASYHYAFKEWVDGEGNPVDLGNITATMELFPAFTEQTHTPELRYQKDPTCVELGYTGDMECTQCGYTVTEGTPIPATGHSCSYSVEKQPTASKTGLLTGICGICSEKDSVTLPKLGLTDYALDVLRITTCTEGGTDRYTWKNTAYGTFFFDVTTEKLGHQYDSGMVTTAPTLKEPGIKTFTCQNDKNHSYAEQMDVLSPSLYFTFDGGAESASRYDNYVYNFLNFDLPEAWRGRTQGYQEGTLTMDTEAGTITVKPGVTGYGSIFADSVNMDLNYDPEEAEYFQIRFRAAGFTGTTFKTGMYFYYSTDNSYVSGGSASVAAEIVNTGEFVVVTGTLPDRVRQLDEVNRVMIYLSGFEKPTDLTGELTLDYVYAGPYADLPTTIYTVKFEDGAGNVLDTQSVYEGETAVYNGVTPTKTYDETYHYVFAGWDRALTDIRSDTVITAIYTSIPHSYTDGLCICGQIEIKEPVMETGWKIGHTLNLASDISVTMAISKASLNGYDMDTVYVLSELDVYEGNVKTGVKTIEIRPEDKGSYYYFTLNGLTAVNMNDGIRSVLYGTKDGQVHYSPVDEYSIATYAYAQMNKATATLKLKTLCAELLRYGSKAQIFKGYRTDALVDANMTEEQKAYLSDMEAVTFGNTNMTENVPATNAVQWLGKSLDLASKVSIKFIFSLGSYTGNTEELQMKVTYKDINGKDKELTISEIEAYNPSRGYYAFTLDSLLAAELRSVLTVQILSGETVVSGTVQYAADTYGNGKSGALGDLCKALFAYSDSAKAYFAN